MYDRTHRVLLAAGAVAVVVLLLASAGGSPLAPPARPLGLRGGAVVPSVGAVPSPLGPAGLARDVPDAARVATPSPAPTWVPIAAGPAPPAEVGATMAYDEAQGETILFGGHLPAPFANEENYTWAYAGGAWTNLTGTIGPAPAARTGASLVYDPSTQGLVLFGGSSASGACFNDTWTFDGTWTNVTPLASPSARQWAAMTWDSAADEVVLFGGEATNGSFLNDTWTYSAGGWAIDALAQSPSVRGFAGFVDDPPLGGAVLFGGRTDPSSLPNNDTELFHAGAWSPIATPAAPVGRANPEMAYDSNTGGIVLFGGFNGSIGNTYYDDTWTFNGTNWTPLLASDTPGARGAGGVAYDAADAYVVVFGGAGPTVDLGDTWVLDLLSGSFETLSPTNGTAPLNVSVAGTASGGPLPYVYAWSWGDGTAGSGATARHMYDSDGVYLVTMNVTDALGSFVVAGPTAVSVTGPLATKFSTNVTGGTAPLSVAFASFTWGGYAPYQYVWTFGDGGTSASPSPVHVYRTAGTFTAALNVTDRNGTKVGTARSLTLTAPPLGASATATPGSGTAPLSVSFGVTVTGGTPPYNESWEFGDGAGAFGPTAIHAYASPGNFTAAVTVRDATSTEVVRSLPIEVHAAPLRSTLQTTPVGVGTLEVHFAATTTGGYAPYAYAWSIGPGLRFTAPEFNLSLPSAGTYPVELTTTDAHEATTSTFTNVTVGSPGSSTTPSCSAAFGLCGLVGDVVALAIVIGILLVVAVVVLLARRRRPGSAVGPAGSGGVPPGPDAATAPSGPSPTDLSSAPVLPGGAAVSPAVAAGWADANDGAAGSISDRLLVRLYDLGRPDPNAPVPEGFTQDGLAASLGTVQSGIARSLQRLEEAGLIVSEVAHVPNRVRRLKVYRLTPRGESEVRRRLGR